MIRCTAQARITLEKEIGPSNKMILINDACMSLESIDCNLFLALLGNFILPCPRSADLPRIIAHLVANDSDAGLNSELEYSLEVLMETGFHLPRSTKSSLSGSDSANNTAHVLPTTAVIVTTTPASISSTTTSGTDANTTSLEGSLLRPSGTTLSGLSPPVAEAKAPLDNGTQPLPGNASDLQEQRSRRGLDSGRTDSIHEGIAAATLSAFDLDPHTGQLSLIGNPAPEICHDLDPAETDLQGRLTIPGAVGRKERTKSLRLYVRVADRGQPQLTSTARLLIQS
ncbi:unnamed protein product [Protopolystoma xenopodis]|uniref:Cadherin domain-containing protein n=1 Tax=Protopolystoma xenopodis TaxID=117903 RepID=A0A3S5AFR5_9PLAT|nr:unnamed protein product [Protopolystoma xenopodis]